MALRPVAACCLAEVNQNRKKPSINLQHSQPERYTLDAWTRSHQPEVGALDRFAGGGGEDWHRAAPGDKSRVWFSVDSRCSTVGWKASDSNPKQTDAGVVPARMHTITWRNAVMQVEVSMDADDKRMRKQRIGQGTELLGEAWAVTYTDHDFYVMLANVLAVRCCISG